MANFLTIQFFLSLFALVKEVVVTDTVHIDYLELPAVCDRKAKIGDTVSLRFKSNLYNSETKEIGRELVNNHNDKEPNTFKLGAGAVVSGLDQGILGMCVGEKRRVTVPPTLGYGDEEVDGIPPKSTLVFEYELVGLKGEEEVDGEVSEVDGEVSEDDKDEDSDHYGHDHDQPDSFAAIDANNDKQISSEEMANYIKKFNDEGGEDKFENVDTIVGEIFQEDDKNKDGVISLEEYQQFEEQPEEAEGDLDPPTLDEGVDADGHLIEDEDEYDDEGNEIKTDEKDEL